MCAQLSFPMFCLYWGYYIILKFFHPCSFHCLAGFHPWCLFSHPWKFGSAGLSLCWKCCFFVFAYDNIADNSLSDVNVFSVKGAKDCVVCGCFNASDNSNAALDAVSADDNVGILYCLGKNSTVSHTRSADVFVMCIVHHL